MPDQAAARGADGKAHREFVLMRGGARQHQIGEIGTSDQQNQAGSAQEKGQGI